MSDSVGVRELRQNLSKYLDRVKSGESLVVTEHGREVARLVPTAGIDPVVQRWAARGARVPATGDLFDVAWPTEPPATPGRSIEEILEEQRADRL